MKAWYFLMATAFYVLSTIATGIVFTCFSPFLLFRCRALYWTGICWANISLFLARILCGIDYKVIGRENIPNGPYIVASKHQSAFETAAFWKIFYIPTFVLKKELTLIPIFGIYLIRMRMICIRRSAGASSLKQIVRDAQYHIKTGRHIIIYPEGTRIEPGRKGPPKYYPGVVALYNHCNVPIVPVALNSGKFWPNTRWSKSPGTITIKILPPIQPGLSKHEFSERLQKEIEENSLALL